MMRFDLSAVAKSLADYLSPHFPGVTFYEDPNQQGSRPPMLFLQQRYASIAPQRNHGFFLRKIGLDLTYLLDYNLPNLQRQYQAAAEQLDLRLETFPYSDGTETGTVRTYDRAWQIDLDALHYKFELRVFVTAEDASGPGGKMEEVAFEEVLKSG